MAAALRVHVRATGKTIDVPEGARLVAGRSVDCDICIDDQSVSRRHLTARADAGTLSVTDLDSANGTFLNEVRSNRRRRVPAT